jgi:hypothetical protein
MTGKAAPAFAPELTLPAWAILVVLHRIRQ